VVADVGAAVLCSVEGSTAEGAEWEPEGVALSVAAGVEAVAALVGLVTVGEAVGEVTGVEEGWAVALAEPAVNVTDVVLLDLVAVPFVLGVGDALVAEFVPFTDVEPPVEAVVALTVGLATEVLVAFVGLPPADEVPLVGVPTDDEVAFVGMAVTDEEPLVEVPPADVVAVVAIDVTLTTGLSVPVGGAVTTGPPLALVPLIHSDVLVTVG